MPKAIKLKEEELNKIKNIRQTYFNIQNAIGQIHLSRLNFENQLDNLNKQEGQILEEYTNTQTAEREFVTTLQDTYGMGTLDIQSGEFSPSPEAPSTEEK